MNVNYSPLIYGVYVRYQTAAARRFGLNSTFLDIDMYGSEQRSWYSAILYCCFVAVEQGQSDISLSEWPDDVPSPQDSPPPHGSATAKIWA